MKFLCLGYFDRAKVAALPQAELDAIMRECGPHMTELHDSGHLIVDAGLELETCCLRRVNGRVRVIDGPFAEAKEVIGGAFLIEAEDMDEAIRVACLHPTTRVAAGERLGWGIAIRPLHFFEWRAPG